MNESAWWKSRQVAVAMATSSDIHMDIHVVIANSTLAIITFKANTITIIDHVAHVCMPLMCDHVSVHVNAVVTEQ